MTHSDLTLLTNEDFRSMGADELTQLIHLALEEQQRRALDEGDVEALVLDGFENGFSSKGDARIPWLNNGLLVCPGSKLDKSALSHDCTFVSIDDSWVWESEAKIYDEVRTPPGPRPVMRTVTVLLAHEGMKVDMVTSQMRTGVHTMKSAKSFVVKENELVAVTTRTPRPNKHR